MGASGGFPLDLIFFGMIAAFLVLRLRSILGRRQGFERPPEARAPNVMRPRGTGPTAAPAAGPVIDGEVAIPPGRVLPDPAGPVGLVLRQMAAIEPGFDPRHFLAGAEAAFRMIVTAFAAGDRATLHPLLSEDTWHAFDGAIAGRETAAETQHTEIRGITSAAIETADLHDHHAVITVRFVSDQVNVTLGRDGQPVAGTDAVTEITDLWTFERTLATPDPTWRLAAARSA